MVRRMRQTLALILAALVVLTSGTAGFARGQAAAAVGEIVICSGQGTILVAVDAEGKPVRGIHVCPDCILTLLAMADAAPEAAVRGADWRRVAWPPAYHFPAASAATPGALARGPPATV